MGPEVCERLRDRLGGAAITDSNAKRTGVLKNRSRLPLTGIGEPCAEGGDIRDIYADQRDVKRERLCLSVVCSPKEGLRHQTSCEPKGSQFVRRADIFQNGMNTSAERSPLPRRLDDESRSERCVLRHFPQLPGQQTPEVPMARETVSVQLPTIRTVVGSMDLYQGHNAGGDFSQNPGHENYQLHRRHPGHGTKQRDCSGAHRLPNFLAGELGVHHQSTEISDRPLARDRILGSHCRLHPNGAPTTGFKDQEHSVRCQDSAASKSTYGSGSVEVSGKVNPCNSRNEGCPPLLQASSVMPSSRPAQPMQDYTQPCPLTKEAREELSWWVTHPTCWNGKSILRGNPDLIIETDASQTGRGARCGNLQTGGPWSPKEAAMHINCLELLAATLAIQTFAKRKENVLIHLKMDSTSALTYITKMGGTVSPDLDRLTKELWSWCLIGVKGMSERSISSGCEAKVRTQRSLR